jgi:hypothetical protein
MAAILDNDLQVFGRHLVQWPPSELLAAIFANGRHFYHETNFILPFLSSFMDDISFLITPLRVF